MISAMIFPTRGPIPAMTAMITTPRSSMAKVKTGLPELEPDDDPIPLELGAVADAGVGVVIRPPSVVVRWCLAW